MASTDFYGIFRMRETLRPDVVAGVYSSVPETKDLGERLVRRGSRGA